MTRPAPGTAPAPGTLTTPDDLVPLPRMLDAAWRFPVPYTPFGWADPAGIVWLDTDADIASIGTGTTPPTLRQVFHDLLTGRRQLPTDGRNPAVFDPAAYLVGLIDAFG